MTGPRTAWFLAATLLVGALGGVLLLRALASRAQEELVRSSQQAAVALRGHCERLQPGDGWSRAASEALGFEVQADPSGDGAWVTRSPAFGRCQVRTGPDGRIVSAQYFPD